MQIHTNRYLLYRNRGFNIKGIWRTKFWDWSKQKGQPRRAGCSVQGNDKILDTAGVSVAGQSIDAGFGDVVLSGK